MKVKGKCHKEGLKGELYTVQVYVVRQKPVSLSAVNGYQALLQMHL